MKSRYEPATDAFLIPIPSRAVQAKLQRDPFLVRREPELNREAMLLLQAGPTTLPTKEGVDVVQLEAQDDQLDPAIEARLAELASNAGLDAAEVKLDHGWKLLVAGSTARHILALGCGVGHELIVLRAFHPEARIDAVDWGTGPDGKILAAAGVEFRQADLNDYAPEERYDLIFSNHVVEHFYDPARMLSRIGSWLNPGGKFVSGLPIEGTADDSFRRYVEGWARNPSKVNWLDLALINPGHPWKTNPANLKETLERAGFADVSLYERAHAVTRARLETEDELRHRRDRLVSRSRLLGPLRTVCRPFAAMTAVRRAYHALGSRLEFGDARRLQTLPREVVFVAARN